jgi:hypothetical protein
MKNILTILMISFFSTSGVCLNYTLAQSVKNDTLKKGKVRHYEREMIIQGSQEEVFAFMDDIRNTGKHMTESSGAMAGSKLSIEWLSNHKTGLGTKYRWRGKVVGMKMDFTVEVSKWIEGKQKVWGTLGDAKMIVIDWFEMDLIMTPEKDGKSNAKLGINYTKHRGVWGFLLGKWYSKWCVKSMLKDTKKHFKKT